MQNICRYANDVSVGDELIINGINDLIPEKVINVTDMKMQGNHHLWFIDLHRSN